MSGFSFGAVPGGGTNAAPIFGQTTGAPNLNTASNMTGTGMPAIPAFGSGTFNTNPTNTSGFAFGQTTASGTQPAAFQPGQQPPAPVGVSTGQSGFNTAMVSSGPASFSTDPFRYIHECLDPSSPNYRFRFFFYNVVPGGMVSNAQIRPPLVSDRLWTQVINDNPDATKMVPVMANGFADLTARRNWQHEHETAQKGKLAELSQRLNSLLTRQDLDVGTQLQVIQKQQLKLTLRLLQLMRRMEVMRKFGQRMSRAEQQLLGNVQSLAERLQQGSIHHTSLERMNEQLDLLMKSNRLDPLTTARSADLADSRSVEPIKSILSRQQKGLEALVDVVHTDIRDVDIMKHGFSLQGGSSSLS